MDVTAYNRTWTWRTFVWAGVVGSVLAWAWVWFRLGGVSAVMLLIALAAVALAYRGTAGMRAALGGVVFAGFAMFLASLYLMYMLLLLGNQSVSAVEVLTVTVFPMVAAVVLLLGAVPGMRRSGSA